MFVSDVLKEANHDSPRRYAYGLIPRGPISAGEWADPNKNIPGFEITTTPQPGDIVAIAHPYTDASGLVAIVTEGLASVGAGGGGSHTTGWPWNGGAPQGTPVYRKCID